MGKETGVDIALRQLEEGVSKITDGESFKRYLEVQARFHRYSFRNVMLIMMQRPGATRVMGAGNRAGTTGWKAIGRRVKTEEWRAPIWILAPKIAWVEVENADGTKDREKRVVGFKNVKVYDVSQTDGEPIPEMPPTVDPEGDGEEMYHALTARCNIPTREEAIPQPATGTIYGYYHRTRREIVLHSPLSPMQKATTLVHEWAHGEMHQQFHERAEAETEAEGVSYVVCSHLGVDTGGFSFPYVAAWAKDKEALKARLDRIGKVAKKIIAAIEGEEVKNPKVLQPARGSTDA